MARVRSFERKCAGVYLEDQFINNEIVQFYVMDARTYVAAAAGVKPDLLLRNVAQRVVEGMDLDSRPVDLMGDVHFRSELPKGQETWVVDLQEKAGVNDRSVFFVQGVCNGEQIRELAVVISIAMPGLHSGGRGRRHEGGLDRHSAERGTEIRNVAFQSRMASIGDRAGAHHADGVRSGRGGLGIIFRERLCFARARPRIAAGAVRV